ncbi:hypothetical protein ACIBF1_46075 [Spirillospora sp. NPDC050679]
MSLSPRGRVLVWAAALSFMLWTAFAAVTAARELGYERAAERGDGVHGVLTEPTESCPPRGDCVWHGVFTAEGGTGAGRWVKARSMGDGPVDRAGSFRAVDVGSGGEVFVLGRASHRGAAGLPVAFSVLLGMVAIALLTVAVIRRGTEPKDSTPWSSRIRALAGRERWGASARPDRAVPVKLERSKASLLAAPLVALPAVAVPAGLWPVVAGAELPERRAVAVWGIAVCVLVGMAALQLLRAAVLPPRLWLGDDELVLWDAVLFWRVLRIGRDDIAGVGLLRNGPADDDGGTAEAEVSPFVEEFNLGILLRRGRTLPARRLRWGNWIWLFDLKGRVPPVRPRLPLRGRTYHRLTLRAADPEHAALVVGRWLARPVDSPQPPEPLPSADHFLDRRPRTHRGDGHGRLTITGVMPQPVLVEIGRSGDRDLSVRWDGGEVRVPPGRHPARTVIDADTGTKRALRVRTSGPWTAVLAGSEAARPFSGTASGRGPDVLAYQGPAGIAAVTGDPYAVYEVRLRAPDLTDLSEGGPLAEVLQRYTAPTEAFGAPWHRAPSLIAVPSNAMLQITTTGGWDVEVLPLARLGAAADPLSGPGMALVRPFGASLTGTRPAVVLYTGPRARLRTRYEGKGRLSVTRLDHALLPVELPAAAEIAPMTLLQVGCGQGRWTLAGVRP